MCVRLKLYQDVNVTGFGKTIGENRAEESEFPDAVALAYLGYLSFGDLNVCDRHFFERLVDLKGFEPLTSSMPWKRAPNCATGPLGDTTPLR